MCIYIYIYICIYIYIYLFIFICIHLIQIKLNKDVLHNTQCIHITTSKLIYLDNLSKYPKYRFCPLNLSNKK